MSYTCQHFKPKSIVNGTQNVSRRTARNPDKLQHITKFYNNIMTKIDHKREKAKLTMALDGDFSLILD